MKKQATIWKIILIFSIILNFYFVAEKTVMQKKSYGPTPEPTLSSSSTATPERKSDWERTEEEIDQKLASFECQKDSSISGIGKCSVKLLDYLEQEITKVETQLKETAQNARGNITINSTYKPSAKELMEIQVKDVLEAHKSLKIYTTARCDLAWFNYLGGAEAGLWEMNCKLGLYKDHLVMLKNLMTYQHPEWYYYPESIVLFMKDPSPRTWQFVVEDAHKGLLGAKDSSYTQLVNYEDAWLQIHFPNSMARPEGFDLNKYLDEQETQMDSSFAVIHKNADENFWKLLEVMSQGLKGVENEDAVIALELAARLDPVRFSELEVKVIDANPENAEILKGMREKWIKPF